MTDRSLFRASPMEAQMGDSPSDEAQLVPARCVQEGDWLRGRLVTKVELIGNVARVTTDDGRFVHFMRNDLVRVRHA